MPTVKTAENIPLRRLSTPETMIPSPALWRQMYLLMQKDALAFPSFARHVYGELPTAREFEAYYRKLAVEECLSEMEPLEELRLRLRAMGEEAAERGDTDGGIIIAMIESLVTDATRRASAKKGNP